MVAALSPMGFAGRSFAALTHSMVFGHSRALPITLWPALPSLHARPGTRRNRVPIFCVSCVSCATKPGRVVGHVSVRLASMEFFIVGPHRPDVTFDPVDQRIVCHVVVAL